MIPLDAATRGLISNNLPLGVATDGLIYIAVSAKIFDASGGVSGKVQEDLYRWRLRDDKELLELLYVIVPFLDRRY